MTVMRNILKLFVVLLAINGAFMTVQAVNTEIQIKAELADIISLDVKTPILKTWELDPAINPFTYKIAEENGVFVSTNVIDAWTVDVNGEILHDGSNQLSDFMTLIPSKQDWGDVTKVYMKEPGTMWTAGGRKGVNSIALDFSQPTSWEDIPSTKYETVLTFTLSH
jgi:hypothetical protein